MVAINAAIARNARPISNTFVETACDQFLSWSSSETTKIKIGI